MASTAEQIRSYSGPAVLSYGFRPFFWFGAIWAALAVAIWIPLLTGAVRLPTHFTVVEWHVHELVYGYVPAVIAGFLLTSVPNWTGRLPVVGAPLAGLFAIWVAGRVASATSVWIGPATAAVVDISFLVVLALVIGREIIAGNNAKNLRVLAVVAAMILGNLAFHIGASGSIGAGLGERIGVAATIVLIMLIGGRIIPSFTRNWLAQRKVLRLPTAFGRFDMVSLAISAGALCVWAVRPDAAPTAWLAVAAGLLNAYRLFRWQGHRTLAEPLVLVLHVAYAFVPIGFWLLALGIAAPHLVAPSGALHGWTAGAIAMMTLAVMTRASLGHTGRPLTATRPIVAIYAASLVAAIARVVAAFDIAREPMLHLSATTWVLAFAGFAVIYAPLLLRPRP